MMNLNRRESQQKGLSIEEKTYLAQNLMRISQFEDPFNFIHTCFGYTLGCINTSLNDRFVFELKKKFSMMQELFFNKMLEKESIALIVIDGIQNFKKPSNLPEKQQKILQTLGFTIQQTLINPHFVYQKWHRQAQIEEQNKKNELAFKQFLQEQSRENKKKVEAIEAQGWECQVCLCEIDKENFGILECSHIFHPQCITAYLRTKIQASELDIKCPMQGCGKSLDVGDIYRYVDADLKKKFQTFSFNNFVQKNNASTAWCPTAGCSAVFEFDVELDNYKCPACGKHYCLRCKSNYHTGMTCAEYRVTHSFDKNDEAFVNFVKGAMYKQCPKCSVWVQRVEGCSTMSCKCGQQFCYDCGGTTCPHGMCANLGGAVRPAVRPPAVLPFIRPVMRAPPARKRK